MKPIKKDIAVFVLISVFVIIGAASSAFPRLFLDEASRIVKGEESVSDAIRQVNAEINTRLRYHSFLMDAESAVARLTGTRRIEKEDGTIIAVADGGMLGGETDRISDDKLREAAGQVLRLQNAAEENGAAFLYVYAPEKEQDLTLPAGVKNSAGENYERFVEDLRDLQVPVLDLYAEKENDNIPAEEMYFVTDHHWKPESGLWAAGKICRELSGRYGFSYDERQTDIGSYDVRIYEKWFLGSQGKKVGTYFTSGSPDDISLITPKFETRLTESQPFKKETRQGGFTETVLYMENLERRDLYHLNAYAVYSGGDFRLQITENELAPDGAKILIVRDSFACAVTPFLALNCRELHTADVREGDYYVGKKLDLIGYIEQIKPDYVIVLYSGAHSSDDSRFDFF